MHKNRISVHIIFALLKKGPSFGGFALKFTFSEKATKINKIFTIHLTVCSNRQIDGEDFVSFCGLLRKHELYFAIIITHKTLIISFAFILFVGQITKEIQQNLFQGLFTLIFRI